MSWWDALKVGLVILGSVGSGGAIVVSLANVIGRRWADRAAENQRLRSEASLEALRLRSEETLATLRGDVEGGLRRLDAALGHRSYLLQRFAEMELEGLRECWTKARACLPAINAPRAINSGKDLDELRVRVEFLRTAHNELLETMSKHEPFLPESVVTLLEQVRQKANLELIQIGSRKPFEGGGPGIDWWDQGRKNQEAVSQLTDALKLVVKARIVELTKDGG